MHIAPPFVVFVGIPCFWATIMWLTAWVTGWAQLGRRFPKRHEPQGSTRSAGGFFCTIYMRWNLKYDSIVRMTAAEDAFYMKVSFLFRPGHPELEIPWSEITIRTKKQFFIQMVELRLGRELQIPLSFRMTHAQKLGLIGPDGEPCLPQGNGAVGFPAYLPIE